MRTIVFSIAVLLILSCLVGCTGYSFYQKNPPSAPTNPKDVQIFSTTMPTRNYEVIGYVSTHTSNAQPNESGTAEVVKNLKEFAAKKGANAIIGFKLYYGGAQGVAIRYVQ